MRRSITDGRPYRLALILLARARRARRLRAACISGPARLVNVIEVNDTKTRLN